VYKGYISSVVLLFKGHVQDIQCGGTHSILTTRDGYFAEGYNQVQKLVFSFDLIQQLKYGQLGLVGKTTRSEYCKSEVLSKLPIRQLYVGGWHNYAKLGMLFVNTHQSNNSENGTFVGWGCNDRARLGDPSNNIAIIETPVALKHHELGITTLAVAGWHTLGLTYDGKVRTITSCSHIIRCTDGVISMTVIFQLEIQHITLTILQHPLLLRD
jgi:hypothetical protein